MDSGACIVGDVPKQLHLYQISNSPVISEPDLCIWGTSVIQETPGPITFLQMMKVGVKFLKRGQVPHFQVKTRPCWNQATSTLEYNNFTTPGNLVVSFSHGYC